MQVICCQKEDISTCNDNHLVFSFLDNKNKQPIYLSFFLSSISIPLSLYSFLFLNLTQYFFEIKHSYIKYFKLMETIDQLLKLQLDNLIKYKQHFRKYSLSVLLTIRIVIYDFIVVFLSSLIVYLPYIILINGWNAADMAVHTNQSINHQSIIHSLPISFK